MPEFNPQIIILFVLLGACVALGMGYGMSRIYMSPQDFNTNNFRPPSDEQLEYMRNVRRKHQDDIWEDTRRGGRMNRPLKQYSIQVSEGTESSVVV